MNSTCILQLDWQGKKQTNIRRIMATRLTGSLGPSVLLCLLLFADLTLSGCSNPNERANKLFVEAMLNLKETENYPSSDMPKKMAAWHTTSVLLDKIVKDFPGSEIAVQLVQEKPILNGKSLSEFRALPDRFAKDACFGQLKNIGLIGRIWATDHNDTLPRSYSELLQAFTENTASTTLLICPKSRSNVTQGGTEQTANQADEIKRIGYQIVQFGLKDEEIGAAKTWIRCRDCLHELHVDGSVFRR